MILFLVLTSVTSMVTVACGGRHETSIPTIVQESHIHEMFVEKTKIVPLEVTPIVRNAPTGPGRCHVRFFTK